MIKSHLLLVLSAFTLSHGAAFAADAAKCLDIRFEKPSDDAQSIVVDRVEGQAVYAPMGVQHDVAGAGGVCVALFSRETLQQVAATTTGRDGPFLLSTGEETHFVLIAANPKLSAIVAPLRIAKRAQAPARPRGLLLHLRDKNDPQSSFATSIDNLALRSELLEMQEVDQAIRDEWLRAGGKPAGEIALRMTEIDTKNTSRLRAIVAEIGWPESRHVGMDGAHAAWLILQHAAYGTQKQLFPLVEAAHRAGEVAGQDYALLLDRTLVHEGKPQVYGSQAKPFAQWNGDEPVLEPIADEANVDARRAEVGLPPLAVYREGLKRMRSRSN